MTGISEHYVVCVLLFSTYTVKCVLEEVNGKKNILAKSLVTTLYIICNDLCHAEQCQMVRICSAGKNSVGVSD